MKKNLKDITKAVGVLKIISNEKRLLILCLISEKELSVNILVELVGLSQSALSQHLALMRNKGFVKTRQDKQTIYYSLASKEIKAIIKTLHKNYCSCNE